MKIGDYVVYLKYGNYSELDKDGQRKDIWLIAAMSEDNDRYGLRSISDPSKGFDTAKRNIVSVNSIIKAGYFKSEYFNYKAYSNYKELRTVYLKEKENVRNKIMGDTMKGNNIMVNRTVSANTDAVKVAAKIATGRTVNAVVTKQLVDRKLLPIMLRGYADSPLGAVVIANIVDFGVKQFAPGNTKFTYVSESMMEAAMVDLLAEFDFEAIMNDVLSNVSLSELED